VDAAHTTPLR